MAALTTAFMTMIDSKLLEALTAPEESERRSAAQEISANARGPIFSRPGQNEEPIVRNTKGNR